MKSLYFFSFVDFELFLLVFKNYLSQTDLFIISNEYDKLLTFVIVFLCGLSYVLYRNFLLRILLIYVFFSSLCIFSWFCSGDGLLVNTLLACLVITQSNLKHSLVILYKCNMFIWVVHTIVIIILFLVGNPIELGHFYVNNDYRYDFGFKHANTFSMFICNIIILYSLCAWEKITYKKITFLLFLSTVVFYFSECRSGFIVVLFFLITMAYRDKYVSQNLIKYIAMFIFPVFGFLMIVLSGLFSIDSSNFINLTNGILNNRVMLASEMSKVFSPSFLGQNTNIDRIMAEYYRIMATTFDCAYTYLFYSGGWFWLVVISIALFLVARKSDTKIRSVIVCFSLYAITEVNVLNGLKFFPILVVSLLFGKIYNHSKKEFK